MAVNWFEGGRRISKLFLLLVGLGGATYAIFINEPTPTLSTYGPTMPWFVDDEDCKATSYQRHLGYYDWGGKSRGIALCYIDIDGDIPYAVAPTPPEEMRRQEAEDQARKARGEPPLIRLNNPWFYTASAYDQRVQAWVNKSVEELEITPKLRERLSETRWAARIRAHRKALEDAAPVVVGLCVFIWLFSLVMGWIVRGFAGIPKGMDFRPSSVD